MKKSIYFISTLVIAGTLFFSCNKKDIEELEESIAELEQKNNEQFQSAGLSNPIKGTIKGNRGVDSVAFTHSFSHAFHWDDLSSDTYFEDHGNGTYDIYIERYGSPGTSSDYSEIWIPDFNPNQPIGNARVYVYMEFEKFQSDIQQTLYFDQDGYFNNPFYSGTPPTENITLKTLNFNPSNGKFSISLDIDDTEADNYNTTDNATDINISFSGTLAANNIVNKMANK